MDRLYGAAFDDFMTLRKQLAAELRAAGETATAQAVAAAPKPTRTAWALNQVARRQPELLATLLRARDEAGTASPGDAERLRDGMREYRARVSEVVRAARELMMAGGMDLNVTQARRMTETLQAAVAEEGPARAQLLAGTLARDAETDDPLAMLSLGGGEAATEADAPAQPKKGVPDVATERRRERERELERREQQAQAVATARARVAELQTAAREALARVRTAQAAADRAARDAEGAKRELQEADALLAAARKELAKLDDRAS
jgi:hypothetical protein